MELLVLDYIVIVLYLTAVAIFGLKASGKQSSNTDYFLGGKDLPWWAVLFSVVATETSTLTFISIPAVAYGGNLTFLQITLGYAIGRVLVAIYFLPKYFDGELNTAYQFLEYRFGKVMRKTASSTFMITRLLADSVRLFATAIPLAIIFRMAGAFTNWNDFEVYAFSIILISVITLVYTYFGGIKAVIWMDVIQMSVYISGAIITVFILIYTIPTSWENAFVLLESENKLKFFNSGFDLTFKEFIAQPYTIITSIVGGAVFSLASHGTDHLVVQRLLSTGNLKSAQKALVGSGIIIILQFALFLAIGLLLFVFYEAANASSLGLNNNDEIFALFIVNQLPVGISGLIIAALFAAAMSTLSSSLNSLASASIYDIIKPVFNLNDELKEVKLSRIVTLAWGFILIGAALFFAALQLSSESQPAVVELGLGIASYTYGGLLGAFLLGFTSAKPDSKDVLIAFYVALVSLLFMVDGPLQDILPGEAFAIAWPLYIVVGSSIVLVVGNISCKIRSYIK